MAAYHLAHRPAGFQGVVDGGEGAAGVAGQLPRHGQDLGRVGPHPLGLPRDPLPGPAGPLQGRRGVPRLVGDSGLHGLDLGAQPVARPVAGYRFQEALGPLDQVDESAVAASMLGRPGLEQQELGIAVDDTPRQQRHPALEPVPVLVAQQGVPMAENQLGRRPPGAGGEQVAECLFEQVLALEPPRRAAMEVRHRSGLELLFELAPQQVPDQVMVTAPLAAAVERDRRQTREVQALQEGLAGEPVVRPPDTTDTHRLDQAGTEAVEDRRPAQPAPHRRRLVAEDLVEQEVLGVPGVGSHPRHQPVETRSAVERAGGETQRHRPSFRRPVDALDLGRVQVAAGGLAEQLGGVRRREPEVGHPDLGHPAAGAVAGERQQRIPAADHHQVQGARRLRDHEVDDLLDAQVGDRVVVVEGEDEPGPDGIQVVDQPARDHRRRGQLARAQERQGLVAGLGEQTSHRGDEIFEENPRLVLRLLERQPGAGHLRGLEPVADQRALAVPGRRRDQGQRQAAAGLEPGEKMLADHDVRGHRRAVQLGAEKREPGDGVAHGHRPGVFLCGSCLLTMA